MREFDGRSVGDGSDRGGRSDGDEGHDPVEPGERGEPGEVLWLEPFPDLLLEGLTGCRLGAGARYDVQESISLAFIAAVQLLPPAQRAILILSDVLGFPAREVAQILGTSPAPVADALKQARATLRHRLPNRAAPAPERHSPAEQGVVTKLILAFENGDVDGVIALLTADCRLALPPLPLEYRGRESVARFHAEVLFRAGHRYRLVPTRANGQPAFGLYLPDPHTDVRHATGLLVLTLAGDRISAMTRFDNSVLSRFGLPRLLPE